MYDVSASTVSSCVVFFLVSFVLFNFASISSLENQGIAKTVSVIFNQNSHFSIDFSSKLPHSEPLLGLGFDT